MAPETNAKRGMSLAPLLLLLLLLLLFSLGSNSPAFAATACRRAVRFAGVDGRRMLCARDMISEKLVVVVVVVAAGESAGSLDVDDGSNVERPMRMEW